MDQQDFLAFSGISPTDAAGLLYTLVELSPNYIIPRGTFYPLFLKNESYREPSLSYSTSPNNFLYRFREEIYGVWKNQTSAVRR